MLSLALDRDLDTRLRAAAARLGRTPEDCAISALRAFVADCEEAAAHARRLSGGETMMRPPDGFFD